MKEALLQHDNHNFKRTEGLARCRNKAKPSGEEAISYRSLLCFCVSAQHNYTSNNYGFFTSSSLLQLNCSKLLCTYCGLYMAVVVVITSNAPRGNEVIIPSVVETTSKVPREDSLPAEKQAQATDALGPKQQQPKLHHLSSEKASRESSSRQKEEAASDAPGRHLHNHQQQHHHHHHYHLRPSIETSSRDPSGEGRAFAALRGKGLTNRRQHPRPGETLSREATSGKKEAHYYNNRLRSDENPHQIRHPLVDDHDVLLHLVPFLAKHAGYLFFGSVAKSWRDAWGSHPKLTHMDEVVESASRLEWASRAPNWVWDVTICRRSAAGGHLGALKYARSQGCPWDEQTCTEAAASGNLSILRWAKHNGCPWNATTCAYAAKRGDLDVLRWARREGCPWDKTTCAEAAGAGELEVLRWARSNGCPWDASTCKAAARSGHLDVLRWAKSEGCPWDSMTCTWAAGGGQLEVLQWARSQGCPWDKTTCAAAAREGNVDVLRWARSEVSDRVGDTGRE